MLHGKDYAHLFIETQSTERQEMWLQSLISAPFYQFLFSFSFYTNPYVINLSCICLCLIDGPSILVPLLSLTAKFNMLLFKNWKKI